MENSIDSENFPYPLNIHVYKIYMQFWNIIWTHYHDLELVKIKKLGLN